MDPACPPAYVPPSPSNPFHRIAQSQRGAFEPLPTYSRPSTREGLGRRRPLTNANGQSSSRSRAPCSEHVIPLTVTDPSQAHTRSWALMRLQSSAKSKNHTPSFHPGDEVVGFIELDLPREKSITSMTIALRGYTVSPTDIAAKAMFQSPGYLNPAMNSKAMTSFLDLKATLWKPSMGDPRTISPSSSSTCIAPPRPAHGRKKSVSAKDFKEKLLGSYSFPFLFTLPREVDNEPLPPDLSDLTGSGKMPVQIKYELEVTIQTALFKSDAMILCPFHVVPNITPPLPSPPRELIYTCRPDMTDSHVLPPGPESDLEGWTSSKVIIDQSSCIVSLAKPLMYTRGTPIHLHLRFSEGSGVPDPSSIRMALVHTVQIGQDGSSSSRSQKRSVSPSQSVLRTIVANGVFYRRPMDEGTGVIHGEIRIPKDLSSDFRFKGVHSEYHVLLFPSGTPAAAIAPYNRISVTEQTLLSLRVKIATLSPYPPESRITPLSFIPPQFTASSSSQSEHRGSPVPRRRSPMGDKEGTGTGDRRDALESLLVIGGNDWGPVENFGF